MQINPVIVALAGRHAQPRVKAERRVERLGSLRYSDLFNYCLHVQPGPLPLGRPGRWYSTNMAGEEPPSRD